MDGDPSADANVEFQQTSWSHPILRGHVRFGKYTHLWRGLFSENWDQRQGVIW